MNRCHPLALRVRRHDVRRAVFLFSIEWTALSLRPVRRMCEAAIWGAATTHRLPRVGSGIYESLGLPHAVNDLAGHLGSTYVIGSISQCLLDVLYFVHTRLIHRFV
jgi:hypothetical protein